jgi:hypothetical protein
MATPTTTAEWILHTGSYAGIAEALLGLVVLTPSPQRGTKGRMSVSTGS